MPSYEQDLYGWSVQTAAALRERRLEGIDLDAVAEEILDVGKHERQLLRSALVQALVHLLKIRYQPGKRTRSWELSVEEHRERARITLDNNPSLKPVLQQILEGAYRIARIRAARQTGIDLSVFPRECEWSIDDVLGHDEPGL